MGLILSRIFVESFRCKRQLVKVAFEKSCPEWAQARKSCKEKKKINRQSFTSLSKVIHYDF